MTIGPATPTRVPADQQLTTSHRPPDAEGLTFPASTLGAVLRRGAEAHPERAALVDGRAGHDGRWTYAELLTDASGIAGELALHHEPGARVALWSDNEPAWIVVELAIALAGLVLVPVNPAFRATEVEHVLTSSGAALLVHGRLHRDHDLGATAEELGDRLGVARLDLADLMASGHVPSHIALPEVGTDQPVQVQFTSGSTGPPKGAVLSHRGLVGMPSMAVPLIDLGEAPVWLNVMPLFHIGGCGLSTVGPLVAGGTQVLLDRFTAERCSELIEREQVTVMGSVPTMLLAMLEHRRAGGPSLASLRVVMSGGAAVAPSLVRTIEAELDARFVVAFGQTETHGNLAQTRPDDAADDKAETVGRPLPHVEVKVVDPATGRVVDLDRTGELRVRSPMLMDGYQGLAVKTAAAFDDEGFLRTGDLVRMDGRGYLTVAGRLDDTISRGGENIAPAEIEDVLRGHEDVADVAVVGIPDGRLGQTVAACIQTSAPALDTDELERWLAQRLASAKVPRTWRLVSELPMTPTGKLQRFRVRNAFLDDTGTSRPPSTEDP